MSSPTLGRALNMAGACADEMRTSGIDENAIAVAMAVEMHKAVLRYIPDPRLRAKWRRDLCNPPEEWL